MRVLCVDDEPNALEASERELKKIGEVSEVSSFLCPEEALEHLQMCIRDRGSTGNSTGNHLHWEVQINGVRQNPLNYASP